MLTIDPYTEMRDLVVKQLDTIPDRENRNDRACSMLAWAHTQLATCTDPTTTKILRLRASALTSILTGLEYLPEDNDPESIIQAGLDGRGCVIVLGYN